MEFAARTVAEGAAKALSVPVKAVPIPEAERITAEDWGDLYDSEADRVAVFEEPCEGGRWSPVTGLVPRPVAEQIADSRPAGAGVALLPTDKAEAFVEAEIKRTARPDHADGNAGGPVDRRSQLLYDGVSP